MLNQQAELWQILDLRSMRISAAILEIRRIVEKITCIPVVSDGETFGVTIFTEGDTAFPWGIQHFPKKIEIALAKIDALSYTLLPKGFSAVHSSIADPPQIRFPP